MARGEDPMARNNSIKIKEENTFPSYLGVTQSMSSNYTPILPPISIFYF
jgi:hypothetical protein